ncbi:MAG: glycosyltransferase, partial [Actinobacteria bacterium]|nr:glycosyltransferase [Actinomycetota bacterium]
HDLSPELYAVKFGGGRGLLYRLLLRLERASFAVADVAIATNESHKSVAVERGGMAAERVFIVRSGPDLDRFERYVADQAWKRGKPFLIVYLGEIASQDGVDGLVRAARVLRDDLGRNDFHCVVIGGGVQQPIVKAYAEELGVDDLFTFTGVVSDDELCRILSSADIGIDPVPHNDWSDRSTMNKIMEYMYFGLPVVAHDLTEARFSAQDAAVYANSNSDADLARVISDLLDDPDQRQKMSEFGVRRVEEEMAWEHSIPALLDAYEKVFNDSVPT